MSKACIVCVGDELLSGAVADRNGVSLAAYLSEQGLEVVRISVVGDDYRSILSELAASSARCDLLVVTGGLGPTSDDRTRDALSLLVGQSLEFDEDLWGRIQSTVGRPLTGSNRNQAFRPKLFDPLINPAGTAPGLTAEVGGCRVVALPGPPHELRAMIDKHGLRLVASLGTAPPSHTQVSVFGVPESRLEDSLVSAVEAVGRSGHVTWHTRAEGGRIILRLVGADQATRDTIVDRLHEAFGAERIVPGETTLGEVVVGDLRSRSLLLAVAESCTGGLIGAALTGVPGSSAVFWGSLVTYANEAKETVLGVSSLAEHGAVSAQAVAEMAGSARRVSGADVAVAVSGVAGPEGGTPDKPVGTVWMGLETIDDLRTRVFHFSGERDRVRRQATTEALLMIRRGIVSIDSA